jgi:hypothetical protein
VQEIVETHGEHGSSKRVKIVSKLEAINIDNKMSGDEFRDRQPQASNPFLLLISLGKTGSLGDQSALPSVQSVALPSPSPSVEVEAEVVSE